MKYRYKTHGVCTPEVEIEINETNDTITSVEFLGPGCLGNRTGIANLVRGKPVREVIEQLQGIRCGGRNTSCPDQLAIALQLYFDRKKIIS